MFPDVEFVSVTVPAVPAVPYREYTPDARMFPDVEFVSVTVPPFPPVPV